MTIWLVVVFAYPLMKKYGMAVKQHAPVDKVTIKNQTLFVKGRSNNVGSNSDGLGIR